MWVSCVWLDLEWQAHLFKPSPCWCALHGLWDLQEELGCGFRCLAFPILSNHLDIAQPQAPYPSVTLAHGKVETEGTLEWTQPEPYHIDYVSFWTSSYSHLLFLPHLLFPQLPSFICQARFWSLSPILNRTEKWWNLRFDFFFLS